MRLMVQMLRTLCRDQVVLVRDELGRLDQLTDEMRVVQFQLADLGQLPAVEAPRPSTNYTTRVESPTSLAPSAERNEIPKETVPVKTSGTSDDAQNGEVVAPGDPHGKERQEQVAPPAPSTAEETHLWLCERLAAIQIERQGLWERILNTVSSKIGGILL
jgi:hypothetical protein